MNKEKVFKDNFSEVGVKESHRYSSLFSNSDIAEFNYKAKGARGKGNNFLGAKDLWIDIKQLPKYFKVFLLVAIVLILFFNFFDVQGATTLHALMPGTDTVEIHKTWFAPLAKYYGVVSINPNTHEYLNTAVFGRTHSGMIATAVLYSLNGLASFTGVLALAMIISGKTSQYFWGLINAVLYGAFALSVGYAADVLMNIILILGAPLGWYLFEVKGLAYKEQKKYSWKFNLMFYIYTIIAMAIVTLVLYEFLPSAAMDVFHNIGGYNHVAFRTLDSLQNGMQLVGYAMQLTNMPQQFIVWLFVDVIKILKFIPIADGIPLVVNFIIEFAVWLSIASYGAIRSYLLPMIRSIRRA